MEWFKILQIYFSQLSGSFHQKTFLFMEAITSRRASNILKRLNNIRHAKLFLFIICEAYKKDSCA